MRTAFIQTLLALAEDDPRIWLLCGDLGYSVLDEFARRFPERFVNVGVAEQNMTGMAAGLALSGTIVFTYSIANFPVLRCLEQIRNDVCVHQANVKIVAVGGGVAYGAQGYTHYAVEDLAVMRALPNMMVVAPGDPVEARLATRAVAAHPGPCYLRLGKAGEPVVHQTEPALQLGRAITLRSGPDVALLTTGGTLPLVMETADLLAEAGVRAGVVSIPFLMPFDTQAVQRLAQARVPICVVEEHGAIGGLSDAVARVLVQEPHGGVLFRTLDTTTLVSDAVAGSHTYLRARYGSTGHGLADELLAWLPRTALKEQQE